MNANGYALYLQKKAFKKKILKFFLASANVRVGWTLLFTLLFNQCTIIYGIDY